MNLDELISNPATSIHSKRHPVKGSRVASKRSKTKKKPESVSIAQHANDLAKHNQATARRELRGDVSYADLERYALRLAARYCHARLPDDTGETIHGTTTPRLDDDAAQEIIAQAWYLAERGFFVGQPDENGQRERSQDLMRAVAICAKRYAQGTRFVRSADGGIPFQTVEIMSDDDSDLLADIADTTQPTDSTFYLCEYQDESYREPYQLAEIIAHLCAPCMGERILADGTTKRTKLPGLNPRQIAVLLDLADGYNRQEVLLRNGYSPRYDEFITELLATASARLAYWPLCRMLQVELLDFRRRDDIEQPPRRDELDKLLAGCADAQERAEAKQLADGIASLLNRPISAQYARQLSSMQDRLWELEDRQELIELLRAEFARDAVERDGNDKPLTNVALPLLPHCEGGNPDKLGHWPSLLTCLITERDILLEYQPEQPQPQQPQPQQPQPLTEWQKLRRNIHHINYFRKDVYFRDFVRNVPETGRAWSRWRTVARFNRLYWESRGAKDRQRVKQRQEQRKSHPYRWK